MAWNDAQGTFLAGTGQIYSAPTGTALPANESSALNSAFVGLGYTTEDGVNVASTPDISEHGAWQSRSPIRFERQSNDFRLSATLLQWDENTVPEAFGGGTITDLGSSHYKFTPPDDTAAIRERSFVIDVVDGSKILRYVITRGAAVEGVESTFNRSNLATLGITIRALEPDTGGDSWYFLANSSEFATGS